MVPELSTIYSGTGPYEYYWACIQVQTDNHSLSLSSLLWPWNGLLVFLRLCLIHCYYIKESGQVIHHCDLMFVNLDMYTSFFFKYI